MTISTNIDIPEKCSESKESADSFCNLPPAALTEFHALSTSHTYARGSTLFMEGQPGKGAYLLCSGHVKLSTYSEGGKAIILRIAEVGEILGLSAVISGLSYEKTAHASDKCHAKFIKKADFLNFLQTHPEAALNALRQLSNNYHKAHIQICSLGLSASVGDKLAKLLLQWCESRPGTGGPAHIPRTHTHVDIAEMIGTTRETVTRLLSDFSDRGLIRLSKTELFVPDRKLLKGAIGSKHRHGHSVTPIT